MERLSLAPGALFWAEASFRTGAASVWWSAWRRSEGAVEHGQAKGDAVDVERRTDEITLYDVAAVLVRERQLRPGLGAFGDHLDRQAVC